MWLNTCYWRSEKYLKSRSRCWNMHFRTSEKPSLLGTGPHAQTLMLNIKKVGPLRNRSVCPTFILNTQKVRPFRNRPGCPKHSLLNIKRPKSQASQKWVRVPKHSLVDLQQTWPLRLVLTKAWTWLWSWVFIYEQIFATDVYSCFCTSTWWQSFAHVHAHTFICTHSLSIWVVVQE